MENYNNNKSCRIKVPTFAAASKVFSGVRFDIHAIELPGKDNHTIKREVVVHPGAVLILPFLDAQRIIMIRNERFAVDQTLWELPAGTLEPNEPVIHTAARELQEETGYKAELMQPLFNFYTTPGICNEIMYTFMAKELTYVGQSLDENERIIVEIVTLEKAYDMIGAGVILDGKTIAALLFYKNFIGR